MLKMSTITKALVLHLIAALSYVAAQSSSASSSPSATVANGTVIGTTTTLPAATAPVNKFLGIPFAKSPPQRFSPPQPADAFNGPLLAQNFSAACIQQFNYPEAIRNFTEALFNYPPPSGGESEDCLYLNVYAPSSSPPAGGRTVMFWIYGGSFQFGTGGLVAYDGSAFAADNDVVLVTHNYRTNVFGFAASSQTPAAERNLGLLDQRMALQWVQENIQAFGGDPSKVTIFGESAGGFSVDAHVTSFTTQNAPFRAAIMQSGQVSYEATNSTSTNNDASLQQLTRNLSCTSDTLTCLRATPALSIKAAIEQNGITFPPVIDGYTYVANRAARRAAGQFAQVPTLIGSNADEGRLFELGVTNLTEFIQTSFGIANNQTLISEITRAFPVSQNVSAYDQASTIVTLIIFQCGSRYLANNNARLNIPTWRYYYNASFPNFSPLNGLLRAYHGAEIPLVFQTYAGGPVNPVSPITGTILPLYLPSTPQQYALGQYMNWAWASFAKNPLLGPAWGKVGSYGGVDLGVLGGSTGRSAGVEVIDSNSVDAKCAVFKPIYEYSTGVSLS